MFKKRLKILLAEDDFNLGMLLVDYLETEGFDVKLCKDGEQALKAFECYPFDLCLLDVMMPKMDGFTLAKGIRSKDKKIPLIFITAKNLREDKLKGYALDADDYITKLFDEEELLWKIKAVFRRMPENLPGRQAGKWESKPPIISIGKYTFDFTNQSLTIAGKIKRITEKEADILNYLSGHRNNLIKREELLKIFGGRMIIFWAGASMCLLLKFVNTLNKIPGLSIENVFGVGFIFNVPALRYYGGLILLQSFISSKRKQ